MATATVLPVAEYLTTTYHPDREYLGGELRERHVGEQSHSRIQNILAFLFEANRRAWGIRSLTEQRVRVAPNVFRIPDVCCVARGTPMEPVLTSAPLLCVEVLSPSDSLSELQAKVEEYLAMGTVAVWIIDPQRRTAFYGTADGFTRVHDVLELADTPVQVDLQALFDQMDEL